MEKEVGKKIGDLITLSMLVMKCSYKQCTKQATTAIVNKELSEKYAQYKMEQNKSIKLQLFAELNNNIIMYELNTCIIKNCKDLVKDLINHARAFLDMIPKKNEKSEKLHIVLNEIENMISSTKLIEKNYKMHIKKIKGILATLPK